MCVLSLVNQLWIIVSVNPWKNHASSELLYKSNRPHFLWVHRGNNPLGMFGRTLEKFLNHLPAAHDFQTFLMFSQTSPWVITPINPQKVWSIA